MLTLHDNRGISRFLMETPSLEEQAISLAHLHILSAEIAADTVLGDINNSPDETESFARAAFKLGYITRCREQLR